MTDDDLSPAELFEVNLWRSACASVSYRRGDDGTLEVTVVAKGYAKSVACTIGFSDPAAEED